MASGTARAGGVPSHAPDSCGGPVFQVEYTEALEEHEVRVLLMKDGEAKGYGAVGRMGVGILPDWPGALPQSMSAVWTFPRVTFEAPGR